MEKIKLSKKVKKVLLWAGLVLGGIIIVAGASYGVVKANDYWQVKQLVKVSDDLVKHEKYQEAYDKLNIAQARWTTAKVKQDIATKMTLDKQLIADQSSFSTANDLFGQSKWQEAKDSYSKVSDKFSHYKEAQDRIKECQSKIDEANAQAQKQAEADAKATADATAKANALAQQKTATNDPFPTLDESSCNGLSGWDLSACAMTANSQYYRDKEAWYARHGMTMPSNKSTNTNCRWVGNNWSCTTQ